MSGAEEGLAAHALPLDDGCVLGLRGEVGGLGAGRRRDARHEVRPGPLRSPRDKTVRPRKVRMRGIWEDQILWRDVGRTMRVAFSSVTSEVEKLATREVMGWGQGWPAATLSSSLCHAQSPSMCSCGHPLSI